jgi:hypothetical protein
MKNIVLLLIIAGILIVSSCKKETESENFRLLTGTTWESDSLLANGIDASGPDQVLENFKGYAKFNEDGTGNFGKYEGTWRFAFEETQIVIETDSLPIPLTTIISELTKTSLKINTSYTILDHATNIRMTFKAKE